MASRQAAIESRWDNPTSYEGIYPPDWDARRRAVYKRDNWTCTACGRRSGPHADAEGVRLHAHHRRPLGDGGSNRLSNLTTLCEPCHSATHGHNTFGSGWIGDTPGSLTDRITRGGVTVAFVISLSLASLVTLLAAEAGVIDLGQVDPMTLLVPTVSGLLGIVLTLFRPRIVWAVYGLVGALMLLYCLVEPVTREAYIGLSVWIWGPWIAVSAGLLAGWLNPSA